MNKHIIFFIFIGILINVVYSESSYHNIPITNMQYYDRETGFFITPLENINLSYVEFVEDTNSNKVSIYYNNSGTLEYINTFSDFNNYNITINIVLEKNKQYAIFSLYEDCNYRVQKNVYPSPLPSFPITNNSIRWDIAGGSGGLCQQTNNNFYITDVDAYDILALHYTILYELEFSTTLVNNSIIRTTEKYNYSYNTNGDCVIYQDNKEVEKNGNNFFLQFEPGKYTSEIKFSCNKDTIIREYIYFVNIDNLDYAFVFKKPDYEELVVYLFALVSFVLYLLFLYLLIEKENLFYGLVLFLNSIIFSSINFEFEFFNFLKYILLMFATILFFYYIYKIFIENRKEGEGERNEF